jgi:hypothetical protein
MTTQRARWMSVSMLLWDCSTVACTACCKFWYPQAVQLYTSACHTPAVLGNPCNIRELLRCTGPVCLLHFPAINTAACCGSSLCTDCYVQVGAHGQFVACDDSRVAETNMRASASVSYPDAPWVDWQVALSRSGHDAGVCPFCNKANYSVVYRAKTTAQRAAERREREHVEQAVLHARQVGPPGSLSCLTWQTIDIAGECLLEYTIYTNKGLAAMVQDEERRSEHRRRKHAANASTPMSPEQVRSVDMPTLDLSGSDLRFIKSAN